MGLCVAIETLCHIQYHLTVFTFIARGLNLFQMHVNSSEITLFTEEHIECV